MSLTAERYQRICNTLANRQTDLTVILEQVHKPHNVAAIIRSCDAIGVGEIQTVWDQQTRMSVGVSAGSSQWVDVKTHDTIEQAVEHCHQQQMQVLVTNLSDQAVDFRDIDYTKPTAIIMGQEKHGATENALAAADQDIVIPMIGMVQSLNVSVASALVLYEAQRQREQAGLYPANQLSEDYIQTFLFERGYPKLCSMCRQRQLPYPRIDEQGQIDASAQWWQAMQASL